MEYRAPVERGVTFFDIAEVFGLFTDEELVGQALDFFYQHRLDLNMAIEEAKSTIGIYFV